jgi:hypothetical protein
MHGKTTLKKKVYFLVYQNLEVQMIRMWRSAKFFDIKQRSSPSKSFENTTRDLYLDGACLGNTILDLYSKDARFESQPGHQLPWLRTFVFLCRLSTKILR